jgi:hypothetical protein
MVSVCLLLNNPAEALIIQSNPFWMPLEFDIGKGYYKVNVFITGLSEDSGLLKICVTFKGTSVGWCHYMDAKEEGQIVAPNVSVHAGIFVFPHSEISNDQMIETCVTIIKDERSICKNNFFSTENDELMVDLKFN